MHLVKLEEIPGAKEELKKNSQTILRLDERSFCIFRVIRKIPKKPCKTGHFLSAGGIL